MGDHEEKDPIKDVVDLLIASMVKQEIVLDSVGTPKIVEKKDNEEIYYMTRNINSSSFGSFVFQLKLLEAFSSNCQYTLPQRMASVLSKQILELISSFQKSIDAKSSESIQDKGNKQSTLIDKLLNRKIEKHFTIDEKAKNGLGSVVLGRESHE